MYSSYLNLKYLRSSRTSRIGFVCFVMFVYMYVTLKELLFDGFIDTNKAL